MIRSGKLLVLVFSVFVTWFSFSFAQSTPPQNWFLLDPATDHYNGVSAERAYNELLKGKTSQTIIVAVIDGGVDVTHEDLKSKIYINPKEIPDNKIDDDKNGYTDDVNGWNFIGGKNGNVQYDQFELTRLYKQLNSTYDGTNTASTGDSQYQEYQNIKQQFEEKSAESLLNYKFYKGLLDHMDSIFKAVGNTDPSIEQLENLKTLPDSLLRAKLILIQYMKEGNSAEELYDDLKEAVNEVSADAQYHYNIDYNSRTIVGDNYNDISERFYGNNDVAGPDPMHGTHVAGIIGADRNNGIGIKGIADNVKILVVRCVPDGDERDKDVGNSIRYAVDMGAKVINMSFGKGYTYNKKAVDDAMKYAMEHDVLLVHGAGNDAEDADSKKVFPNKYFEDGGVANNFINVGASKWDNNVAMFSDYGKKNVDLFAPGVSIYSTVPGNKYRNLQGTSMASPMVAGVAALIRSYFPSLTAPQVREILIKSCTKMKGKVALPADQDKDDQKAKMVKWKQLCVSGGIVNAYKAVQLAEKKAK